MRPLQIAAFVTLGLLTLGTHAYLAVAPDRVRTAFLVDAQPKSERENRLDGATEFKKPDVPVTPIPAESPAPEWATALTTPGNAWRMEKWTSGRTGRNSEAAYISCTVTFTTVSANATQIRLAGKTATRVNESDRAFRVECIDKRGLAHPDYFLATADAWTRPSAEFELTVPRGIELVSIRFFATDPRGKERELYRITFAARRAWHGGRPGGVLHW